MSLAHTLVGAVGSASPLPPPAQDWARGWDGSTGRGALTHLAELALEASGTETLAADGVAGGSMLTLARPLAASPIEARGTG